MAIETCKLASGAVRYRATAYIEKLYLVKRKPFRFPLSLRKKQYDDLTPLPTPRLFRYQRRGISSIKWSDFNNNMLSISRTMTLDYDYHYVMGEETKTESSKRMITIDPETLAILENWRTVCLSKEKIFPILPSRIPEWMHRIIAKCPDVPDSIPYKLHHLHVSILLDANTNIKDIQERLGHASARTTLNIYVDANPNKSFVAYIFTNALNETRR